MTPVADKGENMYLNVVFVHSGNDLYYIIFTQSEVALLQKYFP
jgi:hypothetical protein